MKKIWMVCSQCSYAKEIDQKDYDDYVYEGCPLCHGEMICDINRGEHKKEGKSCENCIFDGNCHNVMDVRLCPRFERKIQNDCKNCINYNTCSLSITPVRCFSYKEKEEPMGDNYPVIPYTKNIEVAMEELIEIRKLKAPKISQEDIDDLLLDCELFGRKNGKT